MNFSPEQQVVFDKYLKGENIFVTGPGGTGKTYLIQQIYQHALQQGKNIQVAATTGCAAVLLNCNAQTIHSWSGYKTGHVSAEDVRVTKLISAAWMDLDILVIDEVSMLSKKLFEFLVILAGRIRFKKHGRSLLFGGIQVIFSGDFYQLPPIASDFSEVSDDSKFCFDSEFWFDVFHPDNHVELLACFRQSDQKFIDILRQIRIGQIKERTKKALIAKSAAATPTSVSDIKPIRIFPVRRKVEEINKRELNQLPGKVHLFAILEEGKDFQILKEKHPTVYDRWTVSPVEIQAELRSLKKNFFGDDQAIQLKVGAQVMCLINIKQYSSSDELLLCNGSQGIVQSFCASSGCPVVKFDNGVERVMLPHIWKSERFPGISISQIPLMLSWAITIHKAQGATFESADIDIGDDLFSCGQMYVALSRVKSFEKVILRAFNPEKCYISLVVQQFYSDLKKRQGLPRDCILTDDDAVLTKKLKYTVSPLTKFSFVLKEKEKK